MDAPGESRDTRGPRRVGRFVLACAAIIAAGAVLLVVRERPATARAAHFEHTFDAEYVGTVWFTITADSEQPREVTVRWARLRRTFEHRATGAATYAVEKGAGKERSEPLLVDVRPPADVLFDFGKAPAGAIDLSSQPWEALPYDSGVAAPRPANADSTTATAAVDESVSYGGVDVAGIGIRKAPQLSAERLTAAKHGEVLTASCWVRGQQLTNGNLSDPADDNAAYSSDVWWRVQTPAAPGYIADVWFARRGQTDKLNLPECPAGQP